MEPLSRYLPSPSGTFHRSAGSLSGSRCVWRGSLYIWTACLGTHKWIYGVDIDPACKKHSRDNLIIAIGYLKRSSVLANIQRTSAGRGYIHRRWGASARAGIATLEEMLPHLQPGGADICEDIHGSGNEFAAYTDGLAGQLNETKPIEPGVARCTTAPFQQVVHSFHLYPFLLVIEKHQTPLSELYAPRLGSKWPVLQPVKRKS